MTDTPQDRARAALRRVRAGRRLPKDAPFDDDYGSPHFESGANRAVRLADLTAQIALSDSRAHIAASLAALATQSEDERIRLRAAQIALNARLWQPEHIEANDGPTLHDPMPEAEAEQIRAALERREPDQSSEAPEPPVAPMPPNG